MESYQTEEFELDAGPAAADDYPMRLIQGQFSCSDEQTFHVPAGHYLEGNWIGSGIAEVGSDTAHPAPDSLFLQWFSYTEDKFYEGRWLLPQRRIYDLLKAGFYNNDDREQQTYDELTVCLVPGGVAVVWLAGDQMKTLIGLFDASEIPYDWRDYSVREETRAQIVGARRSEMTPEVQAEIKSGTISSKKWDEYLQTYPWKIEVVEQVGTQSQPRTEPLTLYHHYMRYLNAEQATYATANTREAKSAYLDLILQPAPKAVPKYFGLFVQNKYNERHEVRIDSLNEAETIAAFQTVSRGLEKEPLTLRVEVDKAFTTAKLTLTNGFRTVPLTKAVVKIFEEDE